MTAWDTSDWPDTLRKVADVIGPELALKLAEECGGIDRLYVPHTPAPNHLWQRSVGAEAFAKLCAVFGGERVTLPRGERTARRKRQIIELLDQGLSEAQIALRCRTTQRYVRYVASAVGTHAAAKDERQLKLGF